MEITVKHIITVDSTVLGLLSLLLENAKDVNVKTGNVKAVLVNKEPEKKIVPKEVETAETTETTSSKPKYTKDELRAEALKVKAKKGAMRVKEILSQFNVSGIKELDDNDIDKCMEAFKGEL